MAEPNDVVGVHLNKNKFPFFNIKNPRFPSKHTGIYPSATLGHVRALTLDDTWFYVSPTGTMNVAMTEKSSKVPYAGANGFLSAVELPDEEGVYGVSFGTVPKSLSEKIYFNPRDRHLGEGFKMHNFFFVDKRSRPVKKASKVCMRDWVVSAQGLVYMSDKEIENTLNKFGLNVSDIHTDLSSFSRRSAHHGVNPTWLM